MNRKIIIEFKNKSLEELSKEDYIPEENEIVIIDLPDYRRKVVVGDGKTRCIECKELKKPPKSILIKPNCYDRSSKKIKSTIMINEEDCI